jgi:hypothetical protein
MSRQTFIFVSAPAQDPDLLHLTRISTQRIWPPGLLAELEAQAAVLPPGDGGLGAQLGLAQDG